jgi:hypothetical protein
MIRSTLLATALWTATLTGTVQAQRRTDRTARPESGASAQVGIVARVGPRNYTSRVHGTCQHEPNASIYGVPAALWRVEAEGSDDSEIRRLGFTLWRPKDGGPDQLSIGLDAGAKPVMIEINPRTRSAASATAQVRQAGPGGTIEVKGKDSGGTKVALTLSCPVFAGIVAEGG